MRIKTIAANGLQRLKVDDVDHGARLDSFLAGQFADTSRAKIQRAVAKGSAKVDGVARKSSYKLVAGQLVEFELPPVTVDTPIPEDIPLEVIYEDDHLVGINKPAGMVVHPARGHWSGTLTAALAFHFDKLSSVGGPTRPGIVHRLDRDTSGIILVAKTDAAHSKLSRQFELRTVEKKYWAFVSPPPDHDRDEISQPIGVHPYQREKMAIRSDHKTSRAASSFYEVIERAGRFALLEVSPKTGRTHQIRVHLAHIGSPVLSDKLYSGRSQLTAAEIVGESPNECVVLNRQALHAVSIRFKHPATGDAMFLEAPLAEDLQQMWQQVQSSRK